MDRFDRKRKAKNLNFIVKDNLFLTKSFNFRFWAMWFYQIVELGNKSVPNICGGRVDKPEANLDLLISKNLTLRYLL